MQESKYQNDIIVRLGRLLPGCFVIKNDPSYIQGIPDLLILFEDKWAMLEVKCSADAQTQPNQPYYIEWFNRLSFAAFIYPENEENVLNALQQTFRVARQARLFEPE